jgi:hypothetical protein
MNLTGDQLTAFQSNGDFSPTDCSVLVAFTARIRRFRPPASQFGLTVAVGALLLVVGIWLLTKATGIL